jgi:rubrerythrin
MKSRRSSLLNGTIYGDAILMYKPGDVVKPVVVTDQMFTGVVRDVDTKINKITVAWGGGPESQHDPDEIMPMPFFGGGKDSVKTSSMIPIKTESQKREEERRRKLQEGVGVRKTSSMIPIKTESQKQEEARRRKLQEGVGVRKSGSDIGRRMRADASDIEDIVAGENPLDKQAQHLENVKSLPGMTNRETDRALRDAIISEESAINQYETIADSTTDERVKDVLQDIADEEKVHVGELQALLNERLSDEEDFMEEGEVEIMASSKTATNPPMDQFCGEPDTHGLDTPVSGGTSVMKDLAYRLHDEANEFADVNPRVASIKAGLKELAFESSNSSCPECEMNLFLRKATSGNEPSAQRTVEEETAKISSVSRKALSPDLVNQIMKYEDGGMDQDEIVEFFQGLIDSGTIHHLQGSYGRVAEQLIRQGLCHRRGQSASSIKATGEMSLRDIQPGGEFYNWAKQIENAAKKIQRRTGNKIKFVKMVPFDAYQGPYAQMSNGKLWSGENEQGALDNKEYFLELFQGGSYGHRVGPADPETSYSGRIDDVIEWVNNFAQSKSASVVSSECGCLGLDGLRSRRAMYWCAPDRTFRLTQQEQESGSAICPKCRVEMNKEKFTRSDKLLTCPTCGFKVPTSKAVTKIEVKVPAGVEVDVTTQNESGQEVQGEAVIASGQKYKGYTIEKSGDNFSVKDSSGHRAFGEVPASVEMAKKWIDQAESGKRKAGDVMLTRRGRFAYVDSKDLVDLPRMSLSQIASLIYSDWKNVNYGAKPYLEAMSSLQNVSDMYGQDSGTSIVAYFLSNANTYKGETAKAIKKELQRRIRRG